MPNPSTGITSLPNEIIATILSYFSTATLLPITPTSRLLHTIILQILQLRLVSASALSSHRLILECYRPADKISTPYFLCEHLYTDTPSPSSPLSLSQLRGLYSHYRPVAPESDRIVRRRHPAGGPLVIVEREKEAGGELSEVEYVSQDIDLESHENFTQLQSQVNLVKVGPRRGLFLSIVEIGEGLTRIFRDWLAARVERVGSGKKKREVDCKERLLWSEKEENIGLKLRVWERDDVAPPILVEGYEDPYVGYTLQYEELVVRASHLLLKYEQSLEQEASTNGKALVIVS